MVVTNVLLGRLYTLQTGRNICRLCTCAAMPAILHKWAGYKTMVLPSKVGGATHHIVVLQSGAVQDPHVKEVITNPAPLRFSLPQPIIRGAVGL